MLLTSVSAAAVPVEGFELDRARLGRLPKQLTAHNKAMEQSFFSAIRASYQPYLQPSWSPFTILFRMSDVREGHSRAK